MDPTSRDARIRGSGDLVTIENNMLALAFDVKQNGTLFSILDKTTGCELLRDRQCPKLLWRLSLCQQGNKELTWIESREAAEVQWRHEEKDGAVTLSLTSSGIPGRPLTVTVTVGLAADSAMSVWHITVAGLGAGEALHQLICPIISGLVDFSDPAPGETLVAPCQGEGLLFHKPYQIRDGLPLCGGPGPEMCDVGIGAVGGRYPGSLDMQMFAFYNERAGLYLATHDAGQNVKEFQMASWDGWGNVPVLRISHFPEERPGAPTAISYDTVLGVFHGDWYDAADIYKAWATQQWWCEKKLRDRDIPDWLRQGIGGVFQMSNYHIPVLDLNHPMDQIADTVNALSAETGVPLLGLVFNWEGGGAWTGPKGFFPPREGEMEFKDAMAKLRRAGNYGFVYITGGCWYMKISYEPAYDSTAEFEAEGRPHAIRNRDGVIPIGRWYEGWESTRLCAHAPYTTEITADIFLQCLDHGASVVQIDNFPCGGSEACYDPEHGHPLGNGPWWSEAWGRLLAEVRRRAQAKNPDAAIETEGMCETFIPWVDLHDHRAGNMEYFGHYGRGRPLGYETIPLFNYVYNEYVGAYYAAMPECNRPEVLYWTRGLGKALCQGVLPSGGRYFPVPAQHNPVTIGFYKRIVKATANECWPYLMFGEMLRAPEIDVPTITAQYCRFNYISNEHRKEHRMDPQQRHEVRDRAVQSAAFRAPDGKSIAYFLINVSQEPVSFDLELSAHGLPGAAFDVARITNSTRADWRQAIALPRGERIQMEPLSIDVILLKAR